jgi:tetratricopeptide (TPR) repeat protein
VHRSIEAGDLDRGTPSLQRLVRTAAELRLPVLSWLVAVLRTTVATMRADLPAAEEHVREALALSRMTDQPDATTWYGVQMFMLSYERGRLGDLSAMFEAAIARGPRLANWHAALALAHAETGRVAEARIVVGQLLDGGYPAQRSAPHWLIGMMCLGSAVPSLGDPQAAAVVYEALAPYAGHWPAIMAMSLGCTDRVLGELAAACGRYDEAQAHLRAAIVACDAAPAPSFAARSRVALANVLLAQGRPGDDVEVMALRGEAYRLAQAHDLARVAQLLAAPVSPFPEQPAPVPAPDLLAP